MKTTTLIQALAVTALSSALVVACGPNGKKTPTMKRAQNHGEFQKVTGDMFRDQGYVAGQPDEAELESRIQGLSLNVSRGGQLPEERVDSLAARDRKTAQPPRAEIVTMEINALVKDELEPIRFSRVLSLPLSKEKLIPIQMERKSANASDFAASTGVTVKSYAAFLRCADANCSKVFVLLVEKTGGKDTAEPKLAKISFGFDLGKAGRDAKGVTPKLVGSNPTAKIPTFEAALAARGTQSTAGQQTDAQKKAQEEAMKAEAEKKAAAEKKAKDAGQGGDGKGAGSVDDKAAEAEKKAKEEAVRREAEEARKNILAESGDAKNDKSQAGGSDAGKGGDDPKPTLTRGAPASGEKADLCKGMNDLALEACLQKNQ